MAEGSSEESSGNNLRDFMQKDVESRRSYMWYGKDIKAENKKNTRALVNKVLSYEHSSPFVNMLMLAMANSGCAVNPDTHIAIEECYPNTNVLGAFDPSNNQIVLCQNQFAKLYTKRGRYLSMTYLLSHELIHAFDHCRAKSDVYNNPTHLMCTEVRAAALSGQCMLQYNKIDASLSGLRDYHKQCVRKYALLSFRAMFPQWIDSEASALLDKVFPSCYNDHEPFDRMPLTIKQAELSYKAYQTRHRYSVK
uniref:Mitochondrial inner membrane protease ATP23 n=1 Tax=Phallusia mammillata TaxID=59560 RepID=A0A6F9DWH9_9ASCI|nr:mitochondrial inner membrane protease ATP23 homolog [Phallusia mammillata]